jgi:hypothetical protein
LHIAQKGMEEGPHKCGIVTAAEGHAPRGKPTRRLTLQRPQNV